MIQIMLFKDVRILSLSFFGLLALQVSPLASPSSLHSRRWLTTDPDHIHQELISAMRNVGVSRILHHRLMLAVGRHSEHPFGSPRAVEYVVHHACADFLAEGMGTLAVFGK
jgi:hypothetical protein